MRLAPGEPPPAVAASLVREALRRGRTFRDHARGGSMRPFIPDGSRLDVRPCDAAGTNPGDVVLVVLPGDRLVAHRLLVPPRRGRPAVTRGDRAPGWDPPIPAEDIIGLVVAATPPGGGRRDLRRPGWRLLGLVLALVGPWAGLLTAVRRPSRRPGPAASRPAPPDASNRRRRR